MNDFDKVKELVQDAEDACKSGLVDFRTASKALCNNLWVLANSRGRIHKFSDGKLIINGRYLGDIEKEKDSNE